MSAQRLQRWAGIGSIPSAGLRRIHTHQAGMSTATQQSQQKNARHWGGYGPMLAQRFQHWAAIGPPPLRGHNGNIPTIILCHQLAYLHNHTIQHVNNTREMEIRYEDSKWLISPPLSFNDPWNPKIINSISAFHVPVLLSTQTFCIQKELVG